jgi:hypothetical protein
MCLRAARPSRESRSDLAWSQRRLHLRCLSGFDGGATLLLRGRRVFYQWRFRFSGRVTAYP